MFSRSRGFKVGTARASCVKLTPNACVEDEAGISECSPIIHNRSLLNTFQYHSGYASLKFIVSRRELSSQSDARSTEEADDLEDGLSELDTPTGEDNDELISEPNIADDNDDVEEPQNELELSDTETELTQKKSREGRRVQSELLKAILDSPGLSVQSVLDKWVEEGKELSRSEVSLAMLNLRKRRMFWRALQVTSYIYICTI